MSGAGVHARGLRRSFGPFLALDGLDLDVPAGTVGAVLGPNGAGKTTSIRILTTLDRAEGGSATVAGYDVVSQPHEVRCSIALTGQYAAVDGDLSGRENLVLIGRLLRLPRVQAKRRADELLERFHLSGASSRLVRHYSGGMRRRLDLAASLVLSPSVVFLDEPTTGLDPPSREELWGVVRTLRESGTTIVLTTQYLEEADRLADEITVIDHGKAVAKGTPDELKAAVGGDIVELRAEHPGVAGAAARFLADRAPGAAVTAEDGELLASVSVPSGSLTAADAVRLLDANGLVVAEVRLRRATLDEVFSTLTART